MQFVNLLYEDLYDDVDIIMVPDEIAENIEQIMWDFFRWTETEDGKRFKKKINGKTTMCIDTEEFLWWLNNIRIRDGAKATIVIQHTKLREEYPIAEF